MEKHQKMKGENKLCSF